MGTLTIRQLDERTHARLRGRAAKHGRSVEAEVRAILDATVDLPEENFLLALHAAMSEIGEVELPLAMPGILLAIAILAYVGRGFGPLVLALSATAWVGYARVARSMALSLKERDFVLAARASGARAPRTVLRHLVPHTAGVLAVQAAAGAAGVLLAEAGLSFLGLGIQPPHPSWGETLSTGCDYLLEAPHLALAPGCLLFLAVWSLNTLGEALSERLDPSRRSLVARL